jgi:hypothetical protein
MAPSLKIAVVSETVKEEGAVRFLSPLRTELRPKNYKEAKSGQEKSFPRMEGLPPTVNFNSPTVGGTNFELGMS